MTLLPGPNSVTITGKPCKGLACSDSVTALPGARSISFFIDLILMKDRSSTGSKSLLIETIKKMLDMEVLQGDQGGQRLCFVDFILEVPQSCPTAMPLAQAE